MGSGGVASIYDPIDMHGFTVEEIEAAVKIAENYGSYCMAHTYNSATTQRLLRAGVKSIEHGMLCDEETFRMMADPRGLSFNPGVCSPCHSGRREYSGLLYPCAEAQRGGGAGRVYDDGGAGRQTRGQSDLVDRPRARGSIGLSNSPGVGGTCQCLDTARDLAGRRPATAAELVELCGQRNPYGQVGRIEPDALADLVLMDPAVLDDIALLSRPEAALSLIVKDGEIVANRL